MARIRIITGGPDTDHGTGPEVFPDQAPTVRAAQAALGITVATIATEIMMARTPRTVPTMGPATAAAVPRCSGTAGSTASRETRERLPYRRAASIILR